MKIFAVVFEQDGRYFVDTPDDPTKPLKEITLGGAVDLQKQLRRYIQDFVNEHIPTT